MFKILYLSNSKDYREKADSFLKEWQSDDDFIVAHTSGSTGKPKEIKLKKADMRVSATATIRRFGLNADSRILCPLSASYIAGKMMIVRAITADCEVAFCQPSNDFISTTEVVQYLAEGAVDLLPIVPSQAECLLTLTNGTRYRNMISAIRNIIIGGAPLPAVTEDRLRRIMPQKTELFATYGMTETCSHIALRRIGEEYFTAMPGVTFSADRRNCLVITANEYSFGELTTNDIITIDGNSKFIWRGRFDNVINTGGIKVFPEEIERKLEGALPTRFYIKGAPDIKWGEAVTIVIKQNAQSDRLSDDDIFAICRQLLTQAERPKKIIRIKELPLTENGKIKRI